MARLYANKNFPLATVEGLRRRGHDVLTTAESGRAGKALPDEDVLASAIAGDRVVLTFDRRDFIRLHSVVPDHAGSWVARPTPTSMRSLSAYMPHWPQSPTFVANLCASTAQGEMLSLFPRTSNPPNSYAVNATIVSRTSRPFTT